VVALFACAVVVASAAGHGPIPEQIAAITKRIEQNPEDATLLLRRGELHRVDRAWSAALADYTHAANLDPELSAVQLCLGRMLLEAGWPRSARISLDRFLAEQPDHVSGLVTRARALAELGDGIAAARDYTHALAAIGEKRKPLPEYYLRRARALAGEGPDHLDEALRGLDEGIKRLGPLVTFELYAIELELARKDCDGALARLDAIITQSPRKEKWLTRRGDILEQAGRHEEARAAYTHALTLLQSVSAHRRRARATRELETRLRTLVEPEKKP